MSDFISREDTIDKMQEVDWYHQNKNGEMVHGANSSEHQARYKAEDVYKVLEDMPPAQSFLVKESCDLVNDLVDDHINRLAAVDVFGKCTKQPEWYDDSYSGTYVKEEDVLKFYYIESLDDYWIGRRLDNFYYATWDRDLQNFVWSKSRYLPWGEHVVAPDTLFKEHTYPSEPKEIPFVDWLKGFYTKYFAADNQQPPAQPEPRWIPCSERLPEVGTYVLISKKALNFRSNLPNVCAAHRSCDPRSGKEEWNDMLFGKLDDGDVLAWMSLPEEYRGEQDE